MVFKRLALESFFERQLGVQEQTSLDLAALRAHGWDIELLLELSEEYAGEPAAARRFQLEVVQTGPERQIVIRRLTVVAK